MATIASRENNVAQKVGNRADLKSGAPSRIDNWIKDAYISVGMGYKFAELEVTAPPTVIAQNTDQIAYPADARAVRGIQIYRADGSPLGLDAKDIKYIRRFSLGTINPSVQGPPSIYAFYGQKIHLRPVVDGADVYTIYIDYWQKPVITADVVSTVLNVPDDWLEIIDYLAAMRAHAELLERDKAMEISSLLYGGTNPTTGASTIGMIQQLMNRRQAEAPGMDYGMQPKSIRSFTSK